MTTAAAIHKQNKNTMLSAISDRVNKNNYKADFAEMLQSTGAAAGSPLGTVANACIGAAFGTASSGSATIVTPYGSLTPIDTSISNAERFSYSTCSAPFTELARYAVPSCMGIHLGGHVFDTEYWRKAKQYPQEYNALMEKAAERRAAVREKYDLDDLSHEEYYYKTHGEQSKEMTDFFYNGFDDEGKRLISFFCPYVADAFGF